MTKAEPQETYDYNNLIIKEVKQVRNKRLEKPITISSKLTTLLAEYKVIMYYDTKKKVDVTPVDAVTKYEVKEIHYSLLAMQREEILNSLRKEVKDFALFVLKFRNKRRGLSVDIRELCRWYAELYDKRADNVYPMIKRLIEVGILNQDANVMMPLFQISGANTKAKEHLHELARAKALFEMMLIRKTGGFP